MSIRAFRIGSSVGVAGLAAAAFSLPVSGQFSSDHISLIRRVSLEDFGTFNGNGNDCWGYVSPSGREYAIMGLSDGTAFVEITNPSSPVILAKIPHPNSLWCDVKVYQHYAYSVNETGGGIQVIDLSDIDSGNVVQVNSVFPNEAHNVALNEDTGYLYICGSRNLSAGLQAHDLSDPVNPRYINAWRETYVHDAQIVIWRSGPLAGHEVALMCVGRRGLAIADVTDKLNIQTLAWTTYPGIAYCHQGWLLDDHRYFYVNDETDELNGNTPTTRTLIFDVSNPARPVLVNTFTTGLRSTDHNLYVHQGLIFEANYRSGLQLFDASDPIRPRRIGFLDTYPSDDNPGYDGAWSTYPFFPSGVVLISDMQSGLFIVDVTAARSSVGVGFSYPAGLPLTVRPDGGTELSVVITPRFADLLPGSGELVVDRGGGFEIVPLVSDGGDRFHGVFPDANCGILLSYYLRARTEDGTVVTDPPGAPASVHHALASYATRELFVDDFLSDRGWTVTNENLSDGAWERGAPAGDGSTGDPILDADGGGACFLTANRLGNSDVDGGPTRLRSPLLDVSGTDALIRYARWFYNDDQDSDRLTVEVSNDDGARWTVAESTGHDPSWTRRQFLLSQFVAPSDRVGLRFSATDNPNNSVTEGAVDAVEVLAPVCENVCLSVVRLTAKCSLRGTLSAKLKTGLEPGIRLHVARDGGDVLSGTTSSRGVAKFKWRDQTGSHVLTVVECPESQTQADCP